jgi:hypothetical protein
MYLRRMRANEVRILASPTTSFALRSVTSHSLALGFGLEEYQFGELISTMLSLCLFHCVAQVAPPRQQSPFF